MLILDKNDKYVESVNRRLAKYARVDLDCSYNGTLCWIWNGYVLPNGYGLSSIKSKSIYAHRLSYLAHHGSIPTGHQMQIDHLCKNKRCFNWEHLELVTSRTNNLRSEKSVCVRGHSLVDLDNVTIKGPRRICKACRRIFNKKMYDTRYSKAANGGICYATAKIHAKLGL